MKITFCQCCNRIHRERPFFCNCGSNCFFIEIETTEEEYDSLILSKDYQDNIRYTPIDRPLDV